MKRTVWSLEIQFAGLLLLASSAYSANRAALNTLQTFASDKSCQFDKKKEHLVDAKALVAEFLHRDSLAEFIKPEPWIRTAVTCPGHESQPESLIIISGYVLRTLSEA